MIIFQGAFLSVNNPDKKILVYNSDRFTEDTIYDYDFVLMPNYALGQIDKIKDIAIFMNMDSFQEMTGDQVKQYLAFAQRKVTYCLYSDNLDRHPYNHDLNSLTEILRCFFDLYPSTSYYNKKYQFTDCSGYNCHKQYLGFPDNMLKKKITINIPLENLKTGRQRIKRAKDKIPIRMRSGINKVVSKILDY